MKRKKGSAKKGKWRGLRKKECVAEEVKRGKPAEKTKEVGEV